MNWVERDLKHIWHPCSQMKDYEEMPPIIIKSGKGIYLYDTEGKRYADVISSWWCNLLGHGNIRINKAIKKQLDELEHVIFCNFSHTPAITLCEKLVEIVPKGLSKFNFTDNGSSAIEAAMKMSFQYFLQRGKPEKKRFMALKGAYHGETIGALSSCGCEDYAALYKPILLDVALVDGPDCYRCKYGLDRQTCNAPCFESIEVAFEKYGNESCAFLVEPLLQGAAGMKVYPPIFLKKLSAICMAYNVLLIADEIATGFGRTGKMFACDYADVTPDIMCISKGLTGGYMPMAIVAVTDDVYNAFYSDFKDGKAFLHSHTYSGNPLACAAASEVINILKEEKIIEKAGKKAPYFTELLKNHIGNHRNIGEIRSIGLINAIELVEDIVLKKPFDKKLRVGREVYKKALEKGLILKPLGDVLYMNPPLSITEKEMEEVVILCEKAIKETLD